MMARTSRVIRGPCIVRLVEDEHGFQKWGKLPFLQQLMRKITPDGPWFIGHSYSIAIPAQQKPRIPLGWWTRSRARLALEGSQAGGTDGRYGTPKSAGLCSLYSNGDCSYTVIPWVIPYFQANPCETSSFFSFFGTILAFFGDCDHLTSLAPDI